ncbi:MAG: formyltetrahydrofolate deformylase [Brevinematales bacterium]|nr:formyltetrahydrofolate deformylase [Brevinematales bacterium]
MGPTAILLLSCPDQKGIVAEIASFIYQYDGNIVHSDQHTDFETNTFFMRIEWELTGFRISREKIAQAFSFIADKFQMQWRLVFSDEVPRVAIMVSKFDHCLYDLLLKWQSKEIRMEIPLIVSNHEDLRPVAEYYKIPYFCFPVTPETKKSVEEKEIALFQEYKVDTVVLARYMQVLSSEFIAVYPHRIINIHHSFLPAFVGAKPYHQAYARGVKLIGATSHYVTEELDNGPIIVQDVINVSHRDSLSDMINKGKEVEKRVLSRAVKLHVENKVLVFHNKTVVFD